MPAGHVCVCGPAGCVSVSVSTYMTVPESVRILDGLCLCPLRVYSVAGVYSCVFV